MKTKFQYEKNCAHCENGQPIFNKEYCICSKKGVTDPGDVCSGFVFDPLKVQVSVRRIPKFTPIPDLEEKNNS